MEKLLLRCSCGFVRGVIRRASPRRGMHAICMCDDCQQYAHLVGVERVLDGAGGTEVFQVPPASMAIESGREHIQCVRLSPKGLYRWYAGCCKTPIANTWGPGSPFAGVVRCFIDAGDHGTTADVLMGPILARVQGRFGKPPLPPGSFLRAPFGIITSAIYNLAMWRIRGWHRPSPFFDEQGRPIAEPRVLELAERKTLIDAVARSHAD